MIDKETVTSQLESLNLRFRMFGRAEIKELRRILQDGEIIRHCVYGFYQGGSGLLVATCNRVILIDKRPFYLNIEDMKFDSLRQVEVKLQSMQAHLSINDGKKKLSFRSVSDARIKKMKNYLAEKIEETVVVKTPFIALKETARPYLNPAWRSRHTILLPRTRPQKFYATPAPVAVKTAA